MTAPACRCGARLKPAGDNWQALDGPRPGDFWCPDGSLHEPSRPRNGAAIPSLLLFAGALSLGASLNSVMLGSPRWLSAALAITAAALIAPYIVMLAGAGRNWGAR